jgi:pimeloyl-ACP methyl ester carboxylesterase
MATFVLVHGAWGGGWEWRRVEAGLRAAGHDVFTPTLTGVGERAHLISPAVGVSTHIEDVVAVLRIEDLHDVVLCGQSNGGTVVTGVADREPDRIAQLVYLDALVPMDGQSVADLVPSGLMGVVREGARTKGDGYRMPCPFDDEAEPGMSEELFRWYIGKMTDHPLRAFEEPIHLTGRGDSIPRTYIRCRQGHEAVAASAELARRLGWRYVEIDGPHDVQVVSPATVVAVLRSIAEGSGPRLPPGAKGVPA